ncbi:hypothetical protein [Deinococcus sp. Leaf326]|uniref:hypothetical protein n=1 Tax=Deinococcus sp. Leaf326 TaxID=1736338 RepID=UPI000AB084DA|nr:hypothetical protein [Deinococcus sp. Leaf326]
MKKIALLALIPALVGLSGCGQIGGSSRVSIGVSASDAGSQVTVTKTITAEKRDDKGVVTTPASVVYSTGVAGPATFIFTSRPGSDAAYVTGYRITRYEVNGKEVTPPGENTGMNVYITSGYQCDERTENFSCPINGTNVTGANGLPSSTVSINFAGSLIGLATSTETSAYSSVDLEFFGTSSNGAAFAIPVKGIGSEAYFNVVNN